MIEGKYNLSLYLLLPLTSTRIYKYTDYLSNDIEALSNGYANDINAPQYDNHMFILLDPRYITEYRSKGLSGADSFVYMKEIKIADEFFMKYTLAIDDAYLENADMIRKNNYFNLSREVKDKIMNFWNADSTSNLYNALYVKAIEPIDIANEKVAEETHFERSGTIYGALN